MTSLAGGWRLGGARPSALISGCFKEAQAHAALRPPLPARGTAPSALVSRPAALAAPRVDACRPSSSASSSRRRGSVATEALPEVLATLAASPDRDLYCAFFAAVGAAIWVKIFNTLAKRGYLEQKLSRKLVHSTAGPLFVLTWPLFSVAPAAKLLAAVVPMINFTRLLLVGSGLVSDDGLVRSVSRSGDRGELLKGPLYYCVVLVGATVLCWRDNPAGLIAISMMCGGDGLADIVGRRFGGGPGGKLPYNRQKSWAGSAAMLLGGYGMSYGLITLFCNLGFFACYPTSTMVTALGFIALAATVVESLPINTTIDDNVSVPLVSVLLSLLLLPQPVAAVAATAHAAMPVAVLAAATVMGAVGAVGQVAA